MSARSHFHGPGTGPLGKLFVENLVVQPLVDGLREHDDTPTELRGTQIAALYFEPDEGFGDADLLRDFAYAVSDSPLNLRTSLPKDRIL